MGDFWRRLMRGRFTITDEFSIRPSWCDSKLSLELIDKGKAEAAPISYCCPDVRNRAALVVRSYLQTALFALGSFIQKFDLIFLPVIFFIFLAWALPLCSLFVLETDIEKLWVPRGGRLESERDFMSMVNGMRRSGLNISDPPKNGLDASSVTDLSAFQVVIQTTRNDDDDILTKDQLMLHVDILTNLSQLAVELYGQKWTMEDLCFKPTIPLPKGDGAAAIIGGAVQSLVPCVMITPLDCFWEGSIPRGPFPPHNMIAGAVEISWQTLDPQAQLTMLSVFKDAFAGGDFDTSDVTDIFSRAGITHAYQTLPCIDPLNERCPVHAPNHIDICDVVKRFLDWNDQHHEYPEFTRIKKPSKHSDYDDFYTDLLNGGNHSHADTGLGGIFGDLLGGDKNQAKPSLECTAYAKNISALLRSNAALADRFLPEKNSTWSNYGKYIKDGCRGFAPNFMQWPEQLIIGGVVKENGTIVKASALQTVIMLATMNDIYAKFAEVNQTLKPGLNQTIWSLDAARYVVKQWQRKYAKTIFNWVNNTQGKRILHPLAAASITDMVEEFSNFNWSFIFIGYGLMIAYACISAMSFARRGVRSCVALAFGGCCTVILANVSGLGCTLILGISFNATTTQILPFLLLSLGVDEMFLLLDKYRDIIKKVHHDEIGVLLRETGLSVLVTYINNIIAFFAGVMLPIPALKVFCVQVAIVLIFNLIAILTVYPALMALDLRRQRSHRMDVLCCIRWPHSGNAVAPQDANSSVTPIAGDMYEMEKKSPEKKAQIKNGLDAPRPIAAPTRKAAYKKWTLTHFVRDYYAPLIQKLPIKIGLCMIFVAFFIASMIGIFRVPIGLELSELIPKESPPYSFFVAREKYFSFYNMFMVMRGPGIDYGDLDTQRKLKDYLGEIRNISYTVKMDLKNDWISMMTDWLKFCEKRFKDDWDSGKINKNGWKEEASKPGIIVYKLLCNQNGKVDCSGVNGNSSLFRDDKFLPPTIFNKSVTAWFNTDSMTYYVSQANFHPAPDPWSPKNKSLEIPDAPVFWYTQFPLFIDGVVDTPATMDMIIKFRDVADKYSAMGLPNFPVGIPFTFWELYIYLKESLITAFGIITAAVFVAISIMLLNPWISAMIVIVLLFMIIIELGFMGLIHIKLNPISAVTLITAVGIRVKFTVHVALSFLTTIGSRNLRVARTLEHMFIPVLHGGISTLLGLIMLGFTKFEFIVMYYFLIMFALVVLGILGGLILMPVLLSWVGPPSEVVPVDDSDYLPAPSDAILETTMLRPPPQSPIGITSIP